MPRACQSLAATPRLSRLFFLAALLSLPLRTSLTWRADWSFAWGLPSNFTSPTVYLSQIFIFLSFVAHPSLIAQLPGRIRRRPRLVFVSLLFIAANILLSVSPPVSLFAWTKVLFLVLLYLLCQTHLPHFRIKPIFIVKFMFISLLAIAQFSLQDDLGGILRLTGEPVLDFSHPQVAKTFIPPINFLGLPLFNSTYLRAYSTFPHPNALAGYLAVGLVILLSLPRPLALRRALVAVCLAAIFATLSRAGLFSAALVLIILLPLTKYLRLALLLVVTALSFLLITPRIFSTDSFQERLQLISVSLRQFSQSPFLGSGLGGSVIASHHPSPLRPDSRLLIQPVHNSPLLLLNEIGLLGLCALFTWITAIIGKIKPLPTPVAAIAMVLIVTGLLDHYWVTSWQNTTLLVVLTSAYFRPKSP